ncbi:MAG: DUF1236 domain-containing protein [Beijerinckiaceae bacterium]|nr:DUF1236 domain-containing protein [Beijerinckiaceae bacterium]
MLKKTLITSAAAAAIALGGAAFAQSSASGSSGASGGSSTTQTPPRSPNANENSRGTAPGLDNRSETPRGTPGSERAQERTGTSGSSTTTSQSGSTRSGDHLTTGQVPKVEISNEQRTQLRTQIQRANIRTVTRDQIKVGISVGAVLPSTVTFVPLPDPIVTIVPQFRGYQAVRVGDQILIVEPGTRRIVYILEA